MSAMRILDPEAESTHAPRKLAPRPSSFDGKVLWILDGHGDAEAGKPVMNRVFRAWKEGLEREFDFAEVRFNRTDNLATPFRHGRDVFEQVVSVADIVINGVAL